MVGAYLQGTTFQAYLPNDGYYDVDLATGERVKTMDVRMADSWGWHLTEQYILESPLLKRQPESPPELGEKFGMELYDGGDMASGEAAGGAGTGAGDAGAASGSAGIRPHFPDLARL